MRWLLVLLAVPLVALAFYPPAGDRAELYLERSIPHVGVVQVDGGPDGGGILVAIIDTGIDYSHPDLYGFGAAGKVAGGYNLVDPREPPIDTNGHGTQVAGIIAADGGIQGVAPASRILAYKVSEDGEGVRPELIVQAIRMATEDGADIINISLGVNRTNDSIDSAIEEAVREGVLVVAAAGNDGPAAESIGSPGRSPAAITVGATYNNLAASRIATLEVGDSSYAVMPMIDSVMPDMPVVGQVVFGGYARERDLAGLNVSGAVVLAERGSDTPGELVYFSIKEHNAAEAGAAAIVVFNSESGIFFGELIHDFVEPGYVPRIPAVSMDRDEGIEVMEMIREGAKAKLQFLYNPDHPVLFSSRGPVSPFYIKPDMMAPGAYVNTTSLDGYNVVSGTSYAAPHVSGAAALLLQQYPEMSVENIRALLTSTSAGVVDEVGGQAALADAGSGRLDVGAALSSGLVPYPSVVVASVTPEDSVHVVPIHLQPLNGRLGEITIEYDAPAMNISHSVDGEMLLLEIGSDAQGDASEGRVIIVHDGVRHTIPVLLYHTAGTVSATQDGGRLGFEVSHPDGWSFAKITLASRNGDLHHVSATPSQIPHIDVYENGLYYVQADIVTKSRGSSAYDYVLVNSVPDDRVRPLDAPDMPWRQLAVVAAIAGTVAAAGVIIYLTPADRLRRYRVRRP